MRILKNLDACTREIKERWKAQRDTSISFYPGLV